MQGGCQCKRAAGSRVQALPQNPAATAVLHSLSGEHAIVLAWEILTSWRGYMLRLRQLFVQA